MDDEVEDTATTQISSSNIDGSTEILLPALDLDTVVLNGIYHRIYLIIPNYKLTAYLLRYKYLKLQNIMLLFLNIFVFYYNKPDVHCEVVNICLTYNGLSQNGILKQKLQNLNNKQVLYNDNCVDITPIYKNITKKIIQENSDEGVTKYKDFLILQ